MPFLPPNQQYQSTEGIAFGIVTDKITTTHFYLHVFSVPGSIGTIVICVTCDVRIGSR